MNDLLIVIEIILRGIIAVSGVAIAYLLIAFYLPRSIMRPKISGEPIRDRGIKKYIYDEGRAIAYEPEISARKYIKQYILLTKNGTKYLKCLINPCVRYLKYDVLVFDNKNKLVDVLNVDEELRGEETTGAIVLPENTSYVSLVLRRADNMYSDTKIRVDYSILSCGIYAAISAFVIGISGALVNSFVRLLFSASRIAFMTSAGAFVSCFVLGMVYGVLSALLFKTKYRRGIN